MPFPETKRVIYQNSPLREVICQLRYPPILSIGMEKPARFQDRIRDLYPLYEEEPSSLPFEGLPKEVANVFANMPGIELPEDTLHKFVAADGFSFISLRSDFVAFTDRRYQRWEQFRESLTLIKEALEGVYRPAFYTRVGLRYKDLIDREALGLQGTSWSQLLREELLGLLGAGDICEHVEGIRSEARIRIEDLQDASIMLRHGLVKVDQKKDLSYLVDVDLYATERSSGSDVFTILDRFNRLGGYLFRWAIKPALQEALRPEELD